MGTHDSTLGRQDEAGTRMQRRDDAGKAGQTMIAKALRRSVGSIGVRIALAAFVLMLALSGVATRPQAAAASTYDPCYTIESKISGNVLEIRTITYTHRTEPDARPNARLVVGPKRPIDTTPGGLYKHGKFAQSQVWVHYGDYLVSKLNGYALDLLHNATTPGTPVVINPVTMAGVYYTPEQFTIDADGYIAERKTGLVLQPNGPVAGDQVAVNRRVPRADKQRWTLVRVPDEVCYPPAFDSGHYQENDGAPITHIADTAWGPTVPPWGNYLPGATLGAHFSWQPDYLMLSTYSQFTGYVPNGGYIWHPSTVRNPEPIRHNNTLEGHWAANWYVGHLLQNMPEELYHGYNTKEGYSIIARLYPHLPNPAGSDL